MEAFNVADWAIIGVIAVSALISLMRGFVKEALSLVVWVAAFLVAIFFHENLAGLLVDHIATPSVRKIAAVGILFLTTLVAGGLANQFIGQLVKMTGLSGTDRLLGMVFGLARGGILVLTLLIIVPPIVPINDDPWFKQSFIIPHFLMMESWALETAAQISEFFAQLTQSGG